MDKKDTAQKKTLKLSEIVVNNGQIEGLPRNPRFIRDNKYKALLKSLEDDPEMMDLREILVYPHQGKYRAAKELGWDEIPCKIIPPHITPDKLRAYTIKDNNQFGEWDWDIANNEWDVDEWKQWGIDFFGFEEGEDGEKSETERLSELEYSGMYFEPKKIPNLKLEQAVDLMKFKEKLNVINDSALTEKQKETLRVFAYRFIKINFETVASYYAFNASEEEKRVIERLRMVLVDGGLDGFIEDDLLRIRQDVLDDEYDGVEE